MLDQWLGARHEVYVFDNYCNSSPVPLTRVRQLTNRDLVEVDDDLRDPPKCVSPSNPTL
ncbi:MULTISPECIES: hypothetical protein [unclassified Sphingopyxis]|uniref:hypothetical protein n=1 Tax=unclassified Sphingopyxis TaxID=2614943 RepID=UPI0012E3D423